ncbi:MAG: sigma-70 family RNA polymerase sigma factor [Xenococcaceae cyanobacterium]
MLPRQGIVEIFSTFIQFDGDRFERWVIDSRLHHNMTKLLTQESLPKVSENFWVIYWHKAWQNQPVGIAQQHLSAYLQEVCFWATNQTITGFTSIQYTIADCFQVAISGIDKVLKGFDPHQGYSLKNYAKIAFSNLIRELLRQRREIDICSDWALLRKLSQKRLEQSLKNIGLPEDTIEQYVLAWNCLKTVYVPNRASSTRRLTKPNPETWLAIAKLYNQERIKNLSSARGQVSPETLETWLRNCVQAARAYLYPNVTSLNQPRPGYDSEEIMDSLPGGISDSLLVEMIASEEVQERNQKQAEMSQILIAAIKSLKSDEQILLDLYYGQKSTQAEIAAELGTKQYNISRKLARVRKSLLKSLAQWSQEKLHISLSSGVLKDISTLLEEWLTGYYQNQ